MRNIICPVSTERINESIVRTTALWVVIITGIFLLIPNPYIPLFMVIDFYIRAFTRLSYSPLSWISKRIVGYFNFKVHLIDKAPKIFAARIGFFFSFMIAAFALAGLTIPAFIFASILILFAFFECGINFCAGCWVYTYVVLPWASR
ncbi:MAG: DUF4395 domain-containing protein [Bacteroidales bacterium]|nr:DUF4395 domain-containing protein [Bacteroidales bacterium]